MRNRIGTGMVLSFILSFLMLPRSVNARNMEGRTGFGVTLHDFDQTPALSMRYHFSSHSSLTLLTGFDSRDSKKTLIIGGKLYQNAHLEENINFYVGVGGFILSHRDADSNVYGGIELDGLLGAEFFLAGLPNLGFQFETGVALRTVKETIFKTLGGGFLGAAIHYYF